MMHIIFHTFYAFWKGAAKVTGRAVKAKWRNLSKGVKFSSKSSEANFPGDLAAHLVHPQE